MDEHARAFDRAQWLAQRRYRRIVVTIPRSFRGELRAACCDYARLATAKLTARQLARVVWPWLRPAAQERPGRGRVRATA